MLWVLIILFLIIGVWCISIYNTLSRLKENREISFLEMQEELNAKHEIVEDVIVNLKEHSPEKEHIRGAQKHIVNAKSLNDKIKAENELNNRLTRFISHSIKNQDLKNKDVFLREHHKLKEIDSRIYSASKCFNSSTKEFNTSLQKFPHRLLSKIYGFNPEPFLQVKHTEYSNQSDINKL